MKYGWIIALFFLSCGSPKPDVVEPDVDTAPNPKDEYQGPQNTVYRQGGHVW